MHTKLEKRTEICKNKEFDSIKENSSKFGFAWLDSSMKIGNKGHNSFLLSNPIADIYELNGKMHIKQFSNTLEFSSSDSNIYNVVEQLVHQFDLCAVGYISYESTLDKFYIHNKTTNNLPSTRFLLYEKISQIAIESIDNKETSKTEVKNVVIKKQIPKDEYVKKVLKIKSHIKEGDIYQANFTSRFELSSPLTPFEVYENLRKLNPAPYSAYLNFGNYQILSSSPERMFKIDSDKISTSPIKGTIALGNTTTKQKTNLETLLNSEKDKAELLMIVDLMRNDLGKIAQTGTVNVDSLFKPEIYSSLIHLVADISAKLKNDISFSNIIDAIIPGGSITGAPKKRAIEIINELEETPRFVYTGSIGYMTKEKSDFNIAIRTIYHKDDSYFIHAGGGIVADSDPDKEYDEMLLKAKNLFKAVGLQDE